MQQLAKNNITPYIFTIILVLGMQVYKHIECSIVHEPIERPNITDHCSQTLS